MSLERIERAESYLELVIPMCMVISGFDTIIVIYGIFWTLFDVFCKIPVYIQESTLAQLMQNNLILLFCACGMVAIMGISLIYIGYTNIQSSALRHLIILALCIIPSLLIVHFTATCLYPDQIANSVSLPPEWQNATKW